MRHERLTLEDAVTFWQALAISRVHAVVRGMLLLVWGFQLLMYCTLGYWWLGPLAVAVQWGTLWGLRWGLMWVCRGVWWGIDYVHSALQGWRHDTRSTTGGRP